MHSLILILKTIKMKPGDWLIILFALALIPLSWTLVHSVDGRISAIEVSVGNQKPVTYPIKEHQKIIVSGKLGDSIIEIQQGRIRMLSSPCTQKLCIISGWHQHSGDSIICLPNKVAVSLLSQQDRFDGINF